MHYKVIDILIYDFVMFFYQHYETSLTDSLHCYEDALVAISVEGCLATY